MHFQGPYQCECLFTDCTFKGSTCWPAWRWKRVFSLAQYFFHESQVLFCDSIISTMKCLVKWRYLKINLKFEFLLSIIQLYNVTTNTHIFRNAFMLLSLCVTFRYFTTRGRFNLTTLLCNGKPLILILERIKCLFFTEEKWDKLS